MVFAVLTVSLITAAKPLKAETPHSGFLPQIAPL